jgi:hypothetical protein
MFAAVEIVRLKDSILEVPIGRVCAAGRLRRRRCRLRYDDGRDFGADTRQKKG